MNIVKARNYPVYHDRQEEFLPPRQFQVSVVTTLRNSGQTVAHELRMHQVLRVAEYDHDHPPEKLPPPGDQAAAASLAAGDFAQINNVIEVQAEEWNAILDGRQRLSLIGRAAYRDVFGGEPQTRWLMEYDQAAASFSFAPYFNSTT